MAPPTAPAGAPAPLPQRVLALAQTLQFGWFVGHLTLLLTTLRYTISFIKFNTNTTTAQVSYRLAFISAAATYGIVVYKAFRAKIKQDGRTDRAAMQKHAIEMLSDENVQYLIMATIWLFTRPVFLALLPFTIYSTFHFLTYLRTALIPTLMPVPPTPAASAPGTAPGTTTPPPRSTPNMISETISRFVKSHYDTSMSIVANLEIALFVRLLLGTIIFFNHWIMVPIYAIFLRIRVAQSPFVRQALITTEGMVDNVAARPDVPPAGKQAWGAIKDGVRKFADYTDFGAGPLAAGGARKTQ